MRLNRVMLRLAFACLIFSFTSLLSLAQPSPANSKQSPVAMVELYFNVKDVEANKKFWVTAGATPVAFGKIEALKFTNVLVFLNQAEPSGGTDGSVINHVGLKIADISQFQTTMKEGGYQVKGADVVGSVYTPENERVEWLLEKTVHMVLGDDNGQELPEPKMTVPVKLHHMHWNTPVGTSPKVKAWYVRNFGGLPGKRWHEGQRWHYEVVIFPKLDMELDLLEVPEQKAPTKGRALDRIGFEIKDLKRFCKQLQANGVTLDSPYKKLPSGVATASLTDPWGVSIELTEGLKSLEEKK